jgi:hypothetical protein
MSLHRPSATTVAVTEYAKAEMQRQHIPGLSLLMVRSGQMVRNGERGLRLGLPISVSVNGIVSFACSIRKSFY